MNNIIKKQHFLCENIGKEKGNNSQAEKRKERSRLLYVLTKTRNRSKSDYRKKLSFV